MANSLYIVYSGGTVNLNSGNITMLTQYVPRMGDGSKVVDSVELDFSGTAVANIQTAVQSVNKAIGEAVRYTNSKTGDKVYVYHQPNGYDTVYRSELMPASTKDWRLELDTDSMGKARWEDAYKVRGVLTWTRGDWWEKSTAVSVGGTNVMGTAGTIINNQDEANTKSFYFSVDGANIAGDTPSPLYIQYKNTTNDAAEVGSVYIGQYVDGLYAAPSPDNLMFQGTASADAGCSGGSYTALVFAGTVEESLISWTIASADDYRGRSYKMVARLKDTFAYTDLYLQAKVLSGSAVLGETRLKLADANQQLQIIGSLKLSPAANGNTNYTDLSLALYSKRAGGGGTINLDYIAAIPQDGWRSYKAISGLAYNEEIYDNPVEDSFYTISAAPGNPAVFTHYVDEGDPLNLVPGVDNTIYFLHNTTGGTAPIDRTSLITLYHYPRRRTI